MDQWRCLADGAGKRVDLLYRDLGKVRGVIDACHAGRIERTYQPGHPHAFVSAIYMGEVALCRVLRDPENVLADLKRRCDPYPPALVLRRRLQLPRRRLPVPDPIRPERRLSPE